MGVAMARGHAPERSARSFLSKHRVYYRPDNCKPHQGGEGRRDCAVDDTVIRRLATGDSAKREPQVTANMKGRLMVASPVQGDSRPVRGT